ncbi:Hypothetical predicted protein, partial [Paramuricea clavata]
IKSKFEDVEGNCPAPVDPVVRVSLITQDDAIVSDVVVSVLSSDDALVSNVVVSVMSSHDAMVSNAVVSVNTDATDDASVSDAFS